MRVGYVDAEALVKRCLNTSHRTWYLALYTDQPLKCVAETHGGHPQTLGHLARFPQCDHTDTCLSHMPVQERSGPRAAAPRQHAPEQQLRRRRAAGVRAAQRAQHPRAHVLLGRAARRCVSLSPFPRLDLPWCFGGEGMQCGVLPWCDGCWWCMLGAAQGCFAGGSDPRRAAHHTRSSETISFLRSSRSRADRISMLQCPRILWFSSCWPQAAAYRSVHPVRTWARASESGVPLCSVSVYHECIGKQHLPRRLLAAMHQPGAPAAGAGDSIITVYERAMAQVWLRLEALAQQYGVTDALQVFVRVRQRPPPLSVRHRRTCWGVRPGCGGVSTREWCRDLSLAKSAAPVWCAVFGVPCCAAVHVPCKHFAGVCRLGVGLTVSRTAAVVARPGRLTCTGVLVCEGPC